jgi:hypothetical protein
MIARFMVKAIDREGNVAWLTRPDPRGFRTVGVFLDGESFPTRDLAMGAITRMPAAFHKKVTFSIEPAEDPRDSDHEAKQPLLRPTPRGDQGLRRRGPKDG